MVPIHVGITHLPQGDRYEEHGVDVVQGCLLEMGTFTVNDTVATPWTTPNFVRATRTVDIDNVNEC